MYDLSIFYEALLFSVETTYTFNPSLPSSVVFCHLSWKTKFDSDLVF